MRVLWIKANRLLPIHSGGDIRSFHIAHWLSTRQELTFLSYYDGPCDVSYEQLLGSHFRSSICIATGKSLGRLARAVDYLRCLPRRPAYAVARFDCPLVAERIRSECHRERFDVVVCDFLDAAINLPEELNVPVVLFQHNVESEIWRRYAETEPNPVMRSIYGLEFRKMVRYESETVRRFQHVIAVSHHDRDLMSRWTDSSRISVVPTGVDVTQYRPDPDQNFASPIVIFVGAMDWDPNVDAMEYFCKKVWPLILRQVPGARLRIVGKNPKRRVGALASESIEVMGRVESVADQLRQAAVVVVPLRIGGGTRLKIYEAMAAGRAVVSTSIGAEGLDVQDGSDIVLADSEEAFSRAVIMLLQDPALRVRFERAAAEAARRYDWPSVAQTFSDVLERTVGLQHDTTGLTAAGQQIQARI